MTLDQLSIGHSCIAKKINGEGKLRRRLFDMGITPNTEIYLRKVAPLGYPLEITIRGYELSLRKSEAAMIEVEEIA